MSEETRRRIAEECDAVKALLIEKNIAYGDSAMDPVRVFSSASPVEQLLVRIDDKLSRIARGRAAGEDVTLDLIGYLILLRVAERASTQLESERQPLRMPTEKSADWCDGDVRGSR